MFLLAKYGIQTAFRFPMVKRGVADYAATGDWTPATGDTKVSKDGGNFANSTNNPSATGGTGSIGWTITLTSSELQAAEVDVQIVDSATKAVEDQWLTIYTYGNPAAKIPLDLSDLVRAGLMALPNAAAEAAGGLYTRGSGAGQINQPSNGQIDARAVSGVVGLTPEERLSIADALLDRSDAIETGLTPRGAMRLGSTADAGKLSGAGTSNVAIRNVGDTKTRIQATVDEQGNRTAVTVDVS